MDKIFDEIAILSRNGEHAVLATVVSSHGSAPRRAGAKMLIKSNGETMGTIGGGALEHEVFKEALKLMGREEPQLVHFELTNQDASKAGMLCGGIVDIFLEPINPLPRLVIFGGGHISLFLSRIGKMLDFHVTIIDDRPEYANAKRFPEADEIVAEDMIQAIKRLVITSSSYIVIVTRGHQHDSMALEWAVATPAAYVGMIGSKKKVCSVFSQLEVKGTTKDQLVHVHAPIGLEIGAETPAEIAVSIMAEIIQTLRQSNGIKQTSDSKSNC